MSDVTARSILSHALVGAEPYNEAQRILDHLARHGWTVTKLPEPAVIPSRRTDPDTSRKAEPTPVKAGTQRAHLLAAFGLEAAVDGLTDEEAADLADGVPYRSEFAKRCSELRAAGLIVDTGRRRVGVAGHERIVSTITDAGRAVLAGLS